LVTDPCSRELAEEKKETIIYGSIASTAVSLAQNRKIRPFIAFKLLPPVNYTKKQQF
jgi:hypothetical protein